MILYKSDKKSIAKRKPAGKKQQAFFAVVMIMVMLLFAACGSGNTAKGPREMPTPDANVKALPTVGPTVTPEVVNDAEDDPSLTEENLEDDSVVIHEENVSKIVVLDPGHGGKFTGAIYYGHQEKDLTLQVANYVRHYLLANYENIEVHLTRETDIALDPDIKIELEQRAEIAKEYNADYFVSLHFNASEDHALHGATVYASFRDNVGEASQGLAKSVLDQLVALGLKNNNVKTRVSQDYFAEDGSRLDYYAVIRHSSLRDIPGIIIEHCFMDNENDYKSFMETDEKLQALAEADAKGIADYLELEKKTP